MEIKTGYASLSLSPTSQDHFEKKKTDDGVFGEMFFDGVSKTKHHEDESKVLEQTEVESEDNSSDEEEICYYGGPLFLIHQESYLGLGEVEENQVIGVQGDEFIPVVQDDSLFGEEIKEPISDVNSDSKFELLNDLFQPTEDLLEESFTSFVQEKEVFQLEGSSLKNEGDLVGETIENIINNETGTIEEENFGEGVEDSNDSISFKKSNESINDLSASINNKSDDLLEVESSEKTISDLVSVPNSSLDLVDVYGHSVELTETVEVKTHSVWLNQEEVFQELVEQSRLLREGDSTKLVLKLYPKMLGHMQVELSLENGILQGRVIVENGEARNLLEQALQEHSFGSDQEINVSVDVNSNFNQESSFLNHHSEKETGFYSIRKYELSRGGEELSEQSIKNIPDLSLNRVRLVL